MEYCSTEYFKCIYSERSPGIWIQYNYDCNPSLYNFRFASSKINVLFAWTLHTYRVQLEKKSKCTSYKWNGTSVSGSFNSLSPLAPEKCFFHFVSYDVQYLKQGSMEHHKNKSSWLSSKYIYRFKKEKDSFPKACLYINPAQGHIWCMLSLFTWLLYTTACFDIDWKMNFLPIRQGLDSEAWDCPPAIPDNLFLKKTPYWCVPLLTFLKAHLFNCGNVFLDSLFTLCSYC